MALTWTVDNDARQYLGLSGIHQPATAVPAASDYATAGYTVTPATFGLQIIRNLWVAGTASTAAPTVAVLWQWDKTSGKLQAFGSAVGATGISEMAASTDLSSITIRVIVEGF